MGRDTPHPEVYKNQRTDLFLYDLMIYFIHCVIKLMFYAE